MAETTAQGLGIGDQQSRRYTLLQLACWSRCLTGWQFYQAVS
ncbi:MAG: hypothetical protein QX195_05680 [Methylococcaceae bacterium]